MFRLTHSSFRLEPLTPDQAGDAESLAAVIRHVHQIGWQLRLGEHIEAMQQEESSRGHLPASESEIEETLALFEGAVDDEIVRDLVESMRQGALLGLHRRP